MVGQIISVQHSLGYQTINGSLCKRETVLCVSVSNERLTSCNEGCWLLLLQDRANQKNKHGWRADRVQHVTDIFDYTLFPSWFVTADLFWTERVRHNRDHLARKNKDILPKSSCDAAHCDFKMRRKKRQSERMKSGAFESTELKSLVLMCLCACNLINFCILANICFIGHYVFIEFMVILRAVVCVFFCFFLYWTALYFTMFLMFFEPA